MKNKKLWVSVLAGIMAAVMLLSLILSLIPTASAASSSEIKDQIKEMEDAKEDIEDQIKDLENQIKDNMSEMETIVAQKDIIDQEIFLLNEQVTLINDQIRAYGLLIADKQDELDAAKAHQKELNEKNKERIRAMEEEGSLSYWSVLFNASSFADLLDRLNMIEEIAAADQRRLEEMRAAAEKVAQAQAVLETEKADLEVTKEELGEAQSELGVKRLEADELLTQLHAKGEEYELMIDEGEAAIEELLNEIAIKEDEYEEAKRQEYLAWLATSVPPTTAPTAPPDRGDEEDNSDKVPDSNYVAGIKWTMPVRYKKFTSPYGWRIHPVYGYRKFHSGVDLAADTGTPIYASRSGEVTTAAWNSSGGWYVTINHGDGFATSYLHMTHYIVSEGQYVTAGQVIGYVGSTGVSTGPHLHFTIYYNGSTVNPANYINFY